ncbi:MAG: choice-of-anchor D domain-containing protein, partial [Verrucomicrobia bacterium]|nr:choice-of-anchor D domain-containing protein [Verrucomicrobiota bacterium]
FKATQGTVGIGHNSALGTGPIQLKGAAISALGSPKQVTNPVQLTASTTFTGQKLTLSGAVQVKGKRALTTQSDVDITGTISELSSGSKSTIEKKGSGKLTLSGNNTHKGGVTAKQGSLAIGHNFALGTGRLRLGGCIIESTSDLRSVANPVALQADTKIQGSKISLTGKVQVSGKRTLSHDNDVELKGSIDAPSPAARTATKVTKKGAGTLTLGPASKTKVPVTSTSGVLKTQGKATSSVEVLSNAATKDVGMFVNQLIVSGNPAMVYYDNINADLIYTRATDVGGTTWGSQVRVASAGDAGKEASLQIVNGNPAIAYYQADSRSLKYVRAEDANGDVWGAIVDVPIQGKGGRYTCLRVVNGKPAISYYNDTCDTLNYVAASDSNGMTWNPAVRVTKTGPSKALLGQPQSLLDVGGEPAISFFNAAKGDLNFVKGDASGVSWSIPMKLDSNGDVGQFPCLKMVGGNPAVSYYDETKGDLKYVRASNAAGTSWGPPVIAASPSSASVGQFNSLEIVNGNPAISYTSVSLMGSRMQLSFVRASNSTGGAWSSPVIVDLFNQSDTGRYSSLLVVNGQPSIAHYDATNKDVGRILAVDTDGGSWPSVHDEALKVQLARRATVKAKDSVTQQKQVRKGGTLANGASPGVMNVAEDMAWEGGAVIEWEINDTAGLAGLNWDLSNVGGSLAVNASADEPIILGIVSLRPDNGPGNCDNFNPFEAQSWRLVNAGGVTGFSAAKFVVSSGAFSNDLHGGSFAIAQNGNNLDVVFTPGPVTNPDITVEQAGAPLASGGAFVDYGTIAAAGATTHTFTIRNDGTDPLTELRVLPAGLLVGGEDADVSNTDIVVDTLNPGQSATFTVTITNNAGSAIPIAASLVIASNDPDENQFVLRVSANAGAGAIPVSEIAVVQDAEAVNLVDGSAVPVSFGTVNTGGTTSLSFTISNSGNADLTGLGFVVDGVNASDFQVSASPVAPVAASSTTTFTIEFTPSSGGTRTAAVHFASNDGDESPFDILLTGTGTASPEIAVENDANASLSDGSVTAEEFGTGSVNSYEEITFTVRNEGTLDLTGLAVSIDGTNASQFSVSSALGTSTIAPDGSASLTVRFAPTTSGAKSAALHITSNDADEPSFDILLAGEGVIAPEIVVEKAGGNLDTGDTLDVGVVATGSTADHTFTIKNTGSADLTDLAVSVEGDDAADFTVTADPAAILSGPSGSTTFTVRFAPSSIGPKNATLRIDSNDSDEAPFDIVLSSAGQPPEIAIEDAGATNIADGGSTSFGSVMLGSSTSLTFTIRNTGLGDLTGLDVSMDGAHSSDFIVTASPVAPVSGSGGSTTFTVEFTPTGTGTRTAAIHIENNDSDENPYDITISGSGLAPEIALEQGGSNVPGGSTQSFGTVALGTNSSLVFSIRNLGTSALNNVTAGISGTHAGDFSLTSSPASTVSGPSGSTTFTVQFTPSSLGSRVATLQILNNDPDENPIQINLTGTGMSSNPLDVWRFSNLGTTANSGNTADLGDFDSDGITNLAEFAFGTNPQVGSSGPPSLSYSGSFAGGGSIAVKGQPKPQFESKPNGVDFRALYVRRKDHATAGLTYTVQFSANMSDWQSSSVTPTVLADDGTHQIVSVPYLSFVAGRKVKFFKVAVTITP